MASACINNTAMSPDTYIDYPPPKCPSYNWPSPSPSLSLSLSPRVSFSHDCTPEEEASSKSRDPEKSDPGGFEDFVGFEFPLEDPGMMLAADELFYEGKLVPLKLSTIRESVPTNSSDALLFPVNTPKMHHHRRPEISPTDPYLFSPKAPSCSMIRWKEILRLKKLYQSRNAKPTNEDNQMLHNHKTTTTTSSLSSLSSPNDTRNAARSLKHFLRRTPKSSSNTEVSSHNLPLLNDSENESSLSISSRLSLSSSSSGHSHEDLPRLSLDSDNNKQTNTTTTTTTTNTRNNAAQLQTNLARARRAAKQRSPPEPAPPPPPPPTAINVSAESPRMNSSGKIVFHSLERSSSSPSTFNGGPRHKHRGIERSYSANVRFTPVLNVPVCSGVFGRSLFASQPRKENNVSATGGGGGGANRSSVVKNRMDRT